MAKRRTMDTDMFNIPVRKKSINGKQKGNTNERECARTVGLWAQEKFTRVPSSGGLRWKDSRDVASDLVCESPDFYFPLTVETKFLKQIHVDRDLGSRSIVYTVWKQVYADAVRCGKLPMAMLRENGMKKFTGDDGEKYQDYYVVFDKRFGGNLMALYCPRVLQGIDEKTGAILIGFKFSDLYRSFFTYGKFASLIKSSNLVAKFIEYANK
jgi:hypothetical protein